MSRGSREILGTPTKRYSIIMFKQILGITFIAGGIIAFFIPVIPGAVLVFLGLELLGITLLRDKILEWRQKRVKATVPIDRQEREEE